MHFVRRPQNNDWNFRPTCDVKRTFQDQPPWHCDSVSRRAFARDLLRLVRPAALIALRERFLGRRGGIPGRLDPRWALRLIYGALASCSHESADVTDDANAAGESSSADLLHPVAKFPGLQLTRRPRSRPNEERDWGPSVESSRRLDGALRAALPGLASPRATLEPSMAAATAARPATGS